MALHRACETQQSHSNSVMQCTFLSGNSCLFCMFIRLWSLWKKNPGTDPNEVWSVTFRWKTGLFFRETGREMRCVLTALKARNLVKVSHSLEKQACGLGTDVRQEHQEPIWLSWTSHFNTGAKWGDLQPAWSTQSSHSKRLSCWRKVKVLAGVWPSRSLSPSLSHRNQWDFKLLLQPN